MTLQKQRRRLFGLFSKDQRDKGLWIEFARESDLDAAVNDEHVFDVAQVWSREDGATAVSMRVSSPSGDWFDFVESCFRPDGTLARVHSTLNTFNAVDKDPEKEAHGATRERERYFNASGRQIKVSRRVLDLQTGRPAPTFQIMDEDKMDEEETIYRKTTALPFAHLLNSPRRSTHAGVAPAAASSRH